MDILKAIFKYRYSIFDLFAIIIMLKMIEDGEYLTAILVVVLNAFIVVFTRKKLGLAPENEI